MRLTMRAADQETLHRWDGLVVFWTVLWIVVGVWTGVTLWQASDTGDTISNTGQSIETVGDALSGFADVPLIGERPGEIGEQVTQNGADIDDRGQEIKGQLRQLALLLGLAVVAIPITPVLGLYLPLRLERRREVAGVRRQLAEHPGDGGLEEHLAERARANLPYDQIVLLRAADPAATRRRLADAELARLGISAPRRD